MQPAKQRIIVQTVSFLIFIILITTFLSIMGGKFERVQQAVSENDYQTIQEETKVLESISKSMQQQKTKSFFTVAAIVILGIIIVYALQGKKEQGYINTLRTVAKLHGLSFYQENKYSYPTATGSDDLGIIMIEVVTSPAGKKNTTITLGLNQTETIIINAQGDKKIIGSKKAKEKITSTAKRLVSNTEGTWYVRAGELRYEHPNIANNEEQLSNILTAAKKLRKDLT